MTPEQAKELVKLASDMTNLKGYNMLHRATFGYKSRREIQSWEKYTAARVRFQNMVLSLIDKDA